MYKYLITIAITPDKKPLACQVNPLMNSYFSNTTSDEFMFQLIGDFCARNMLVRGNINYSLSITCIDGSEENLCVVI